MTGLRYVALADCARIAGLDADPVERAAAFADVCRLNALYMIERAGSGHPGTTFSSIDIVTWLHLEVLGDGDRYFSSKGHDVPGLYAVLAGARQARLRPDPPAPPPRRPARPPRRGSNAGGGDQYRLARHGRLEGTRLRARRSRARALGVGSTCSPATASSRRVSSGSRSSRLRTAGSARSP